MLGGCLLGPVAQLPPSLGRTSPHSVAAVRSCLEQFLPPVHLAAMTELVSFVIVYHVIQQTARELCVTLYLTSLLSRGLFV